MTVEITNCCHENVECSICVDPKSRQNVYLISNFSRLNGSTLEWIDMASYGMCIHDCTDEEIPGVYRTLKELDRWELYISGSIVTCNEKKKEEVLQYLQDLIHIL